MNGWDDLLRDALDALGEVLRRIAHSLVADCREAFLHVGQIDDAHDLAVERVHDLRRRFRGREDADPEFDLVTG